MTSHSGTRVVLLTGAGRGAVASLLVEGRDAGRMVDQLFHSASGRPLEGCPLGRIVYGRWQSATSGEEVVVCRRATNRVEVHCHGGRAAAAAILDSLVQLDCQEVTWQQSIRQSEDDPVTADARIALADAKTERTAIILLDQHAGALRHAVEAITAALVADESKRAVALVDSLLKWTDLGRHLVEPWKVVLVGRPNVGKSSLINALLGYQRAIVHPVPGTTRDIVTAAAAVDGWPIELADTAGLRAGGGPLEAAGIELARDSLRAADLVVLVFDQSQPCSADDETLSRDLPHALRVSNKCDLAPGEGHREPSAVRTSALRGDGVDRLVCAIAGRLVPQAPGQGQGVPFLPWHVEALRSARAALLAGQIETARSSLAKFTAC